MSEENFRLVFEQGPLGMALADLELRLVRVNGRLCQMLGYTEEELTGKPLASITDPDDMGRMKSMLEATLRGEPVSHRVEKRCVKKDGSEIPVALTVSLVRDEAGKPVYFMGMVEDLTERKKTVERLQLVEDATRDGIWDMDMKKGTYEWSDALYESLGYRPGEFEANMETVNRLIHPDDVGPMWEAVGRHLHGELPAYETEFRVRHKGGRWLWMLSRGKAIFDSSGKPVRMVGSHTDITRRKEAEAALREARAEAERANRAKDDFLAVLSHELRTPLTPALTTAQMLEEEETLSAEHREWASLIRRNVELEARLIDDLLDLTRIARNKLAINMESVDVHEALNAAFLICAAEFQEKELKVTKSLAARPHFVRGDSARLQQVFWNLFKNAVKFSFRGGEIHVSTRTVNEKWVEITVTDAGIGIEPAVMPQIFNAFEQGGKDVTRQFGGLGLGLTISKVLVELHGGKIGARSSGVGKGSVFSVELPTGGEAATHEEVTRRHEQAAHHATILLVEDHPDTRRVMARYLEATGCTVTTATTVSEALALAQHATFDLVISDIGLPDGLGTDLMKDLAARYGLKGVALSGFGMEEDHRRSREAGFEAHLTKPVDLRQLDETIRGLVGGKKS